MDNSSYYNYYYSNKSLRLVILGYIHDKSVLQVYSKNTSTESQIFLLLSVACIIVNQL